MKSISKITLFLALLISFSFKQTENPIEFFMDSPDNWYKNSNDEIYNNLNKFKLTKTQLDKYISDHKGSVLFVSYTKYEQSDHTGLIPTIQVNIRNNNTGSFDNFFEAMKKSVESMPTYFKDFEYIDVPKKVKVGNRDAFYFSSKFTMKSGTQTIKPRSRTYAVPIGNKFFQLNFTDGDDEDCTTTFDSLIKSIKFN